MFGLGERWFIFAFRNDAGRLEQRETTALGWWEPPIEEGFGGMCSKIIVSGRTDADFIRVSVWYLQPLNTVDLLKRSKENIVVTGPGNHGHPGAA